MDLPHNSKNNKREQESGINASAGSQNIYILSTTHQSATDAETKKMYFVSEAFRDFSEITKKSWISMVLAVSWYTTISIMLLSLIVAISTYQFGGAINKDVFISTPIYISIILVIVEAIMVFYIFLLALKSRNNISAKALIFKIVFMLFVGFITIYTIGSLFVFLIQLLLIVIAASIATFSLSFGVAFSLVVSILLSLYCLRFLRKELKQDAATGESKRLTIKNVLFVAMIVITVMSILLSIFTITMAIVYSEAFSTGGINLYSNHLESPLNTFVFP
ncbi:hypothetical protein NEFER03_1546 [Nematocida sp. LUAm3]|nr:hypothetical protein NEFER03_1546 [Nematocida sp. LUAm3]KAI5174579.1 hypothetical protein NEFER02_0700 [Nematocida sp. LUAm2]KAI5178015.1 hypothetical protein NEFER01_1197 [Nematocida sp. LUAm1]